MEICNEIKAVPCCGRQDAKVNFYLGRFYTFERVWICT